MEFLAPFMLLGVLAVAIPIAIHLFGKQRAKVIKFAAVDYLLGSDERVARRLRIRDFALLALRALVCLALPLAIAKPYTSCQSRGPAVDSGPQAAVLVIDNSLVSATLDGDSSLLDRSIRRAEEIVNQLGADSEVSLVLAAEGSGPPGDLSGDHLKLIADIKKLRPVPRPADTTTALRRAAELLSTSQRSRRRVFLMTPLVANGFRANEAPWSAENAPELIIIDVAEKELQNIAVTGVSIARDPDSGSRGIRVTAQVTNFGTNPAVDIPAELRIADTIVARGTVSVPAKSTAQKVFTGSLPEGARAAPVSVAIRGDNLRLDNRRYAVGELRDQVRTLLVNGDPRSTRHADELFYLETALRPGDRDESGIVLSTTTADGLAEINLERLDVVVLANVPALPNETSDRLADWVKRGGGLWISVGDNVEATDYNSRMGALLVGELKSLVDTTFGRNRAEQGGSALHLTKLERDHPIFSSFSPLAPELREATFRKVFLLGTTTATRTRRVLARYDNGAAAMLESTLGEGRLLLFTSSLDRDWNELAIQPGYLPMVQQAVRYLGRKPSDLRRRDGSVGGSRLLSVPADVERIEVVGPDTSRTVLGSERIGEGGRARFDETDKPGFYQVWTARAGAKTLEAAVSADFALNIDVAASEIERLDPSNLPSGAGGQSAVIANANHRRRVELWHALAALLIGFLLIESVLALRS